MKILKNLTLKKELFLIFGIILMILIALGVGGVYVVNDISSKNQLAISDWKNINYISEKENEHLEWVNELNRAIMLNNSFEGELDHTECDFGKSYYELINSEEFNNMSIEQQEVLLNIEKPHQNLHNSADKIVDILKSKNLSSKAEAIKVFKNETLPSLNHVQNLFSEYKNQLQTQASENVRKINIVVNNMRKYIITILGSLFILTLLFVYFFSKRINTSLSKTINLADNIANGNLRAENLQFSRNDEFSDLAASLNKMKDNIRKMILNINNIARDLS